MNSKDTKYNLSSLESQKLFYEFTILLGDLTEQFEGNNLNGGFRNKLHLEIQRIRGLSILFLKNKNPILYRIIRKIVNKALVIINIVENKLRQKKL